MKEQNRETEAHLKEQLQKEIEKNARLQLTIQQKDEYIVQAQQLINHYATGKLMKLNHFMFRLKGQYFKGQKEDKEEFKAWLKGKAKNTNKSIGAGEQSKAEPAG